MCSGVSLGQTSAPGSSDSIKIIAGKASYARSALYQKLFGRHYRKEWTTPVLMPYFYLDTAAGGLKIYKLGGGRQTRTLRLRNKNEKEFVLRSIDKSFGGALPELYRGTWIEDFVDDQVTIAHPYGALIIPSMAQKAGIYHTLPTIVYLEDQTALKEYSHLSGELYLFEQRPDEDWSEAPNFARSDKIISTENILEKTLEENDHVVDQKVYLRARLFDYLIGDWGRHEDQWRWARVKRGDVKQYLAIPRDRDQAFTVFDGKLLQAGISLSGLRHFQGFHNEVQDVPGYNFPPRFLDRRFLNGLDRRVWIETAQDLKARINDSVIARAVSQLPGEVYPISGPWLIERIKSRRDNLVPYAEAYYENLAENVDIPGTRDAEWFQVVHNGKDSTHVSVFRIENDGVRAQDPFYSRVFLAVDTREVRLYGIGGADVYDISRNPDNPIKVRIIGGPDHDSLVVNGSPGKLRGNVTFYDNSSNHLSGASLIRLKLSKKPTVHEYHYDAFRYSRSGMTVGLTYNSVDRLFLKAGYRKLKHSWRKKPFASSQEVFLGYSVILNGLSLVYNGHFNKVLGPLGLQFHLGYDAVRWAYFHGLGNETDFSGSRSFYRFRSSQINSSVSLVAPLNQGSSISASAFLYSVNPIDETDKYFSQLVVDENPLDYSAFTGHRLELTHNGLDDPRVPTKGISFIGAMGVTRNLERTEKSYGSLEARLQAYMPLGGNFILATHTGVETVNGNPEFYQYASIGGAQTLRGYVRERFWGRTAFYSANELRWLPPFRSYLFNGRAGLLALYDVGRVWMPGEQSDKLHAAWGGGVLLAPFNRMLFGITYAISEENRLFQIRISQPF